MFYKRYNLPKKLKWKQCNTNVEILIVFFDELFTWTVDDARFYS